MIKLNELESYLQLAISHARLLGISEIKLQDRDYYLTFGDERFVMGDQPKAAVGSLYDDFEELKKLSDDPTRVSCLDLDRLAEALHLLSDAVCAPLRREKA
jgi:hypothetical protein